MCVHSMFVYLGDEFNFIFHKSDLHVYIGMCDLLL